jgi:hypothetical protein
VILFGCWQDEERLCNGLKYVCATPEALKPDVDPEVSKHLTNFYSQTFWCNIGAFKCTQAMGRPQTNVMW